LKQKVYGFKHITINMQYTTIIHNLYYIKLDHKWYGLYGPSLDFTL